MIAANTVSRGASISRVAAKPQAADFDDLPLLDLSLALVPLSADFFDLSDFESPSDFLPSDLASDFASVELAGSSFFELE